MSSSVRRLGLRAALLILLSWIAVGAISGSAVYRIMRFAIAEEAVNWESPERPTLAGDPSALAVEEDLARTRPLAGRTAPTEASGPSASSSTPTSTSAGASSGSTTPRTAAEIQAATAQRQAEQKAAALQELRAERRQVFQSILSGGSSWSALTPEVLGALGTQDIASGLAQVQAMPWGPEANRALQGLLKRWAEIDPRAAAEYALGLDSNRAGGAAIRSIWNEWADQDAGGALDWYLKNLSEHPAMLTPSLRAAFMQLAAQDPARALATAWQLPDAMGREALKAIVSQAALDGGLESLRSVVLGMTPGGQRNQMIAAIIQEYSVYQPAEAVHWINMMDNADARNYAVNQLVSVWGYDRPAEAADWVSALPDDVLRGRSAATLMRTWSATEPDEAARWLQEFAPARVMDSAVEQFIRNTMFDDPARAMAFVERLVDPKRRRNLVLSVGRVWAGQSPEQARAYFQTSSWDAAIRNRFL